MKKKSTISSFALFLVSFLISAQVSAQSYRFSSLPMGAGGFVSGLITSRQQQNLLYCRTDVGGAYRWNPADSTWKPLQDWSSATQSGFYGVESMAIDPSAPNKLYMLVGINYFDNGKTAILKSDDYGDTFTVIETSAQFKAHGNGMGRSNGERLIVDPNLGSVLYAGTRDNGLWQSTNSGLSWTRLTGLDVTTTANGNGISFIVIDPASGTAGNASQTIYVGVSRFNTAGENFYKSTDGGLTFNPVTGGPAGLMPQRATLAGGNLYLSYANGAGPFGNTAEPMNNGGLYRYNLSAGTFTNITPTGVTRAWGGITVDPANPMRLMASTINNYQLQYGNAYGDRIYLSTNGGSSWTDVVARGFVLNNNGIPWITGQAIHWAGSLEFDPFNSNRVLVTSGNGIFTNNNIDVAATPWKFEVKGLEELVPRDMVSLPGGPLFSVCSDYDGFKHTSVTEYGQRLTPTMGTTTGIAYAGANPNYLIRVGSRMYYSTNQGTSWTQTAVINGSQGRVTVTADGSTILHGPNGSSSIFYSTNNGTTWTLATNTTGGAFNISNAIPVADMVNPAKVYVYNNGSGNFSVSNSSGATFAITANIGSNGSKIIRTVPGLEGHIWVPMYNGGLRRSVNSGTSFTTIAGVTACSAIGFGKAAPGATYLTLYIWGTVGGVTGLFRSTDEGASWLRINTDATQFGGPGNGQFVLGDMNTFGHVYMSTVGRGVVLGSDAAVAPLPVKLGGFTVKATQGAGRSTAELSWTTLSEVNTSHFEIGRSTDGVAWPAIGMVQAKGSGSTSSGYSYSDDITTMSGKIYYRLKMVDVDGRFTYGPAVPLYLDNKKDFMVTVAPNPAAAGSGITMLIRSQSAEKLHLKITTANGVEVLTKQLTVPEGSTTIPLPEMARQPAGVYLLQVRPEDGRNVLKVVRFVKR